MVADLKGNVGTTHGGLHYQLHNDSAASVSRGKVRYTGCMATIDIASLSLEERLRLLDELWESLSQTPEASRMTLAQRDELDRRLDKLDREGPMGIAWEEVVRRIRSRAQ